MYSLRGGEICLRSLNLNAVLCSVLKSIRADLKAETQALEYGLNYKNINNMHGLVIPNQLSIRGSFTSKCPSCHVSKQKGRKATSFFEQYITIYTSFRKLITRRIAYCELTHFWHTKEQPSLVTLGRREIFEATVMSCS
jgi:hypothetical protein